MKPGPPSLKNTADGQHQQRGCIWFISLFVEQKKSQKLTV